MLVVVEAVNLLQLLGVTGFIAAIIINLILGIIGFGSFVRVLLAPTRKVKEVVVSQNNSNIREAKPEDFVMKGAPIKEDKREVIVQEVKEEVVEKDIKEEIVENEIKEEKSEKIKKENLKKEENKEKKDNKNEKLKEDKKVEKNKETKEEEKKEDK